MTYEAYLKSVKNIEDNLGVLEDILEHTTNKLLEESGLHVSSGLVPDVIRASDSYRIAKNNFDFAFKNYRTFNELIPKNISKEEQKIKEQTNLQKSN